MIEIRSKLRTLNDRRKNENHKSWLLKDNIFDVEFATSRKTILKKNLCEHILKKMSNNKTMLFEFFFDTWKNKISNQENDFWKC